MSFLLDTDICSAYLKARREIFGRFAQYSGGLFISTVTLAELWTWAGRAGAPTSRSDQTKEFLETVHIVTVDEEIALACGIIRAGLLDRGITVPLPDLMIAATALTRDLTLVTHNVRDYSSIPNLRIQDWLAAGN